MDFSHITLISEAFAQDAGAAPQAGGIASLIPLVLIFFIFYLLILRPQQKKVKAHQAMVQALSKGDMVITAGGIEGKIKKIEPKSEMIEVEIASGVTVRVVRSTVGEVLGQAAPEKETQKAKAPKKPAKKGTKKAA